jgi:DivIVA domain-containing protein
VLRYGAYIEARRQRRIATLGAEIRTRVPASEVAAVHDVRFSTALRGYDRDQVDRYINRVNQLLAELQITAAPESAIKHALEEVSLRTRSAVQDAEREAEEITRASRSRAEDRIDEARREAEKVREAAEQDARQLREAAAQEANGTRAAAETRIRGLESDVQAMIEKRDRAIEELVELSRSLDELLKANGDERNSSAAPARTAG